MSFSNFKILAEKLPQLAEIAYFSEKYVYTDPQSSVAKSRLFIESLTKVLYKAYKIDLDTSLNLVDLLSNQAFRNIIPNVILYKIHSIRKSANTIVHGGNASSSSALAILQELYEISKWCAIVLLGVKSSEYPDFIAPPKQKEKKEEATSLEDNIKLQEKLKELDELKLELEKIKNSQISKQIAVNELKYSEEQTRKRLIDSMIRDVGWNIDYDGKSSDDVGQEIEVDGQPTNTGKGYCNLPPTSFTDILG